MPTKAKHTASTVNKGEVALKAFFNIAEKWQLNRSEQMLLLGLTSESTYHKWKTHPNTANLDGDKFERISYILGIWKDLQTLLSDTNAADDWVRQPNSAPAFGGRSALEVMCKGKVADLYQVRTYLAAERRV